MAISDNLVVQIDVNTRGQSATVPYDHVNSQAGTNYGSPSTVGSGNDVLMSYDGSDGMYSEIALGGDSWKSGPFTIAARINEVNAANGDHLVGIYTNSSFSQNVRLEILNGNIRWRATDEDATNRAIGDTAQGSSARVFVLTYDGTDSWEAFVDGSSVGTVTWSGYTPSATYHDIAWGANTRSTQHVAEADVDVQWFAVWDAVKSLADIQALDDSTNPFLGNDYTLECAAGSYAKTGNALSMLTDRDLTLVTGVYSLVVSDILMTRAYAEPMVAGAYEKTGIDVSISQDRILAGEIGEYASVGSLVSLITAVTMQAEGGTYLLDGYDGSIEFGAYILADSGEHIFTGAPISFVRSLNLPSVEGTYGLSGASAQLRIGVVLPLETAEYAYVGSAASFSGSNTLAMAEGSYGLSGDAIALLRHLGVSFSIGEFIKTGGGIATQYGRKLVSAPGDYFMAGLSISFIRALNLAATTGAFAFSGEVAELTYSPVTDFFIYADSVEYSVSGAEMQTAIGRYLDGETGAFEISSEQAGIYAGVILQAEGSAYDFTGGNLNLEFAAILVTSAGTFLLDYETVSMIYSGEMIIGRKVGVLSITTRDVEFPIIRSVESGIIRDADYQ